jgi:hypothetical protein
MRRIDTSGYIRTEAQTWKITNLLWRITHLLWRIRTYYGESQIYFGELELTMENHKLTLENHELTMENHKLTLENHEITLENHEITLENHEISLENHEITLGGSHSSNIYSTKNIYSGYEPMPRQQSLIFLDFMKAIFILSFKPKSQRKYLDRYLTIEIISS